ncbi:MAG TPA: methylated-DNA--[protein]-cysteine S-methyltransferase [Anaerolineae bacterium]|nr:methylated-DNA--[protein]-cysteine S-methyltransferase [Anaerolineae bacterium]
MSEVVHFGRTHTPALGDIWVAVHAGKLVAVVMGRSKKYLTGLVQKLITNAELQPDPAIVAPFLTQFDEYFTQQRQQFDLPIAWHLLKPFQARTLRAVAAIPYGETRSYGAIAKIVGQPGAAQAVGVANATNPMPIILPCHRVVGSDGQLHGYSAAGGLASKAWLLQLEGVAIAQQLALF